MIEYTAITLMTLPVQAMESIRTFLNTCYRLSKILSSFGYNLKSMHAFGMLSKADQ
jgi:hypothetical protein